MKFESQYLTEKFKNKDAITELEKTIKKLSILEDENINFNIFLNDHLKNNESSLSFEYNGKKIKIEKEGEEFSGEISDGKNKIGIPDSEAKSLYNKCRRIYESSEILDDERTFQ